MILCVHFSLFNLLLKFLNNDDILHIIYNKSSQNQLNLQYVNQQKKLTSNYYLNLLVLG